MYDKVRLWVDRGDVGDQYSNIALLLDEAKEQTSLTTGEVSVFGSLKNLKVSLYVGGLSIVGSLPKYLYGHNIAPLSRESTQEAFEEIADALHISLRNSKITMLEFGCNFLMKHKVEKYLERLGDMPRLQRYSFSRDTLYYKYRGKQQPRTYIYYDKIADAKIKQMPIPDGLQNANILRVESRYKGRLPHQLRVAEVSASTLSDFQFYAMLMKRLQDSYYSIGKLRKENSNIMAGIKSVGDAFDFFVGKLIAQTGQSQDTINGFLEELKDAKTFKDRVSYTRLKQRIERAALKTTIAKGDELITELDDMFQNAGAYL